MNYDDTNGKIDPKDLLDLINMEISKTSIFSLDEEEEDLDEDLLMLMLDAMSSYPMLPIGVKQPEPEYTQRVYMRRSNTLLNTISTLAKDIYWSHANSDLSSRLRICTACHVNDCNHIKEQVKRQVNTDEIEKQIKANCTHKDPEENFLNDKICVQCLIDYYSNLDYSKEQLISYLIDDADIANYAIWATEMGLQHGLIN
jgi:hypothetical protein